MDDFVQLGGSIELSGFRDIDGASMVVLKKVIGNYAKHMSEISGKFEKLSVVLKLIHEGEASKKFEVHAKLINNGSPLVSQVIERNIFIAVDNVLKNIESQLK